ASPAIRAEARRALAVDPTRAVAGTPASLLPRGVRTAACQALSQGDRVAREGPGRLEEVAAAVQGASIPRPWRAGVIAAVRAVVPTWMRWRKCGFGDTIKTVTAYSALTSCPRTWLPNAPPGIGMGTATSTSTNTRRISGHACSN